VIPWTARSELLASCLMLPVESPRVCCERPVPIADANHQHAGGYGHVGHIEA